MIGEDGRRHCDLCHGEEPRDGYDDGCCCCAVHMAHGGEFTGFSAKEPDDDGTK